MMCAGQAAAQTTESAPSGPVESLPQDQQTAPPATTAAPPGQEGEIIVTGSRIPQPNLDSAAPVTVISTEDVKLQGTTKVEDLLNSLPSVVSSQNSSYANGADGTATVDLRGLGATRTLTLVNGRRLVPGDPLGSSAADINIIPASMLKRVEVLTGGASSTYGADAVAGVVNFIIDTDFTGIRFDGQYGFYQHNNRNDFIRPLIDARADAGQAGFSYPDGNTADGGAFDGTVSIGTGFDDDRGHAVAYFGYRKQNAVLQSARDYSSCVIQNSSSGANNCGGSLTSGSGNVLLFDTAVATGTSTVYNFTPGGGFENATNRYNFAPTNHFVRPDERYTAGVFANYEINESIKPYLEFMFMDDRTVAQIAPSGDFGNTLTVNCDNPLMSATQRAVVCDNDNLINGFIGTFPTAIAAPYNQNPGAPPIDFVDSQGTTYNKGYFLLLRRNVEGGPRMSDLQHTTYRGVLGSKGNLGDVWSYDAYYQYGRVNYSQVYTNEFSVARLNNALNVTTDNRPGSATFGQPVCRSVLDQTDVNCVPYNVFAGEGGASQASIDYLSATGFLKGMTSEQVANVSFTGLLGQYGLTSPWADDGVGVNFGFEWRRESLELQADNAFSTGDLTGQGGATLPLSGNFRVYELFAETQIPIVQDGFVYDLSLNAGYRRSWYKTSSDSTYDTDTYKVGAEFAPVRDIRFRATYNRAVRAPNIQELFQTNTVGLDGSDDPCAGFQIQADDYGCLAQGLNVGQGVTPNPAAQYNGFIGGNPDLQPEKATTKSVGVVLQPRFVPGLAITVDYFDIKVEDAIRTYGADAIISDCVANATASFTPASCDLINRDAAGSLWLTPGGYITDLPNNVGEVQTKGIEVGGSYSHDIGNAGTLALSMNGTYLDSYRVDNGLTQPYDCAGYYGPTCSVGGSTDSGGPLPQWRHKARATFQTEGGIGLSVQWRYLSSVDAETLQTDNQTIGSAGTAGPGEHIDSFSYFDLALTATIADMFRWRVGVNNVFDKEPPLVTSGGGGHPSLCPTGPCSGNTYPGAYDPLGRYIFTGITLDF